jgi:hypothetical protein
METEKIEKVQGQITAKVGSTPCGACGAQGSFAPDTGFVGVMVVEFNPDAPGAATADKVPAEYVGENMVRMDAVAFVCSNCGFIRHHAVPPGAFHAEGAPVD